MDIPELLESILLQLPLQDLLRVQGVNKTFRDAIKASHQLQVKLFFKTDPPKDGSSIVNPFLERILKLVIDEPNVYSWKKVPGGKLFRSIMCQQSGDEEFTHQLRYIKEDLEVDILRDRHTSLSDVPNGSWREMLVVDPPRAFDIPHFEKLRLTGRKDSVTPQNANELLEAIDKWI